MSFDLKKIGYQVGTGFMVGSPYQTFENLADDMLFLKELNPQMVGIGPFIPHHDTPFADQKAGSADLTLVSARIDPSASSESPSPCHDRSWHD